jgi:hypothetical protein
MNIKLRKKNELQCISVSVKELFGEGGGNEKNNFKEYHPSKNPTTSQQVIQGTRVQPAQP